MRVIFFGCAESSVIDIQTNRLSLFHILDDLTVASAPFVMSDVSIALVAKREADDPKDFNLKINIRCGDRSLFDIPINLKFGDSIGARNITRLNNLLIPTINDIDFSLLSNDQIIASWKTDVHSSGPGIVEVTRSTGQAERPVQTRRRERPAQSTRASRPRGE